MNKKMTKKKSKKRVIFYCIQISAIAYSVSHVSIVIPIIFFFSLLVSVQTKRIATVASSYLNSIEWNLIFVPFICLRFFVKAFVIIGRLKREAEKFAQKQCSFISSIFGTAVNHNNLFTESYHQHIHSQRWCDIQKWRMSRSLKCEHHHHIDKRFFEVTRLQIYAAINSNCGRRSCDVSSFFFVSQKKHWNSKLHYSYPPPKVEWICSCKAAENDEEDELMRKKKKSFFMALLMKNAADSRRMHVHLHITHSHIHVTLDANQTLIVLCKAFA